jgi:hypothetical protein
VIERHWHQGTPVVGPGSLLQRMARLLPDRQAAVEAADLARKTPLLLGVAKLASPLVVFGDDHEIQIRKLAAHGQGSGEMVAATFCGRSRPRRSLRACCVLVTLVSFSAGWFLATLTQGPWRALPRLKPVSLSECWGWPGTCSTASPR